MYDTIDFIIPQQEFSSVNFLEDLPQYLTTLTSEGESGFGQYVNGYLDTFKVSINDRRVKLQASSLSRYINGDNQQGMSLQLARKSIEKLSDQLHLDFGQAKITRLDVGRNIITKYNPSFYLPYLGESTGHTRQEAGEGLYYKNSLRTLAFYDKIKEQKKRKHLIQQPFIGHNLLRYELRLTSQLERELKQPNITAKLLCDEDFYINLGKLWKNQYLKIIKRGNDALAIAPTTSTRELMATLASISIQNIGDEKLMNSINEWQEKGLLSKKQACDHRKFIRQAVKLEMKKQGNEFIDELDKKIKMATRFFV